MMSMAMVYPSQPQTMVGESTAAVAAVTTTTANRNSWHREDRQSRLARSNSNGSYNDSFSPATPVVKRTATMRNVSHSEPMQGFLIIESDSEDDDEDCVEINIESDEEIPSGTKDCMHTAASDPSDGRRSKPLPQIPMYLPELQHEPSMYYKDESPPTPITPTKIMYETPFLMIPTLEPIQESLDSAIEEESSFKHEEDEDEEYDLDSDEDQVLDIAVTGHYNKQGHDTPTVDLTIPYDEKTTVEELEEEKEEEKEEDTYGSKEQAASNTSLVLAPVATNEDAASVTSSIHLQKPFEPTTPSSLVPMQIPHTPDEIKPPTIWSVDNVGTDNDSDIPSLLRRRVSKEEVQPQPLQYPSNISICSRCSSISSASTSVLSNNDMLRAAVHAKANSLNRAASAVSLHTQSTGMMTTGLDRQNYNHHQQPLVLRSPMPTASVVSSSAPSLHKSQSTPRLSPPQPASVDTATAAGTVAATAATAAGPETSVALSSHPLLQPIPVKSRLSIASFSLTHDKDAIKTYRRMARKINNTDFQMTYTKYLLNHARLYNDSKTNRSTRERLLSEASYWIEKLAKKNVAEALFIKAKWHLQPELEDCAASYRHKPQPSKAFKCLHAAASLGWVAAHYELARLQKSRGESAQAVASFKRAAAKGHTLATYKMAKVLLRGQLQQARNIKQGLQYLHKAADANDSDSAEPAYVLSCVYADELERVGIARDTSISHNNPTLALQYLHKAAQTGLPMAVHRMGQVHEHGLLNQPRNPWLGYSFYLRAAEDGHEGAMLDLSRLYVQGIPGYLMHQHAVAFKWCQRAAAKGLQEAEYVLGTYYEDGVGTRPDYPLALECFSKAASKGYAPAAEKLNLPMASSLAAVAAATQTAPTTAGNLTNDLYQSSDNRLSSLRIKKQPAAERPVDDESAVDPVKDIDQATACHIM